MFKNHLAALAVLSLVFLAGCGGGDKPAPNDPQAGAPPQQAGQDQPGAAPAGGNGPAGQPALRTAPGERPAGQAAGQRTGAAGSATGSGLDALSSGKPIDTSYIPATAIAAVYVQPGRILESPAFANLDLDDLLGDMIDEVGVDPRQVEQFISVVTFAEGPFGPMPGGGGIVRFKQPYDRDRVGGTLFPPEEREEARVGSKVYYHSDNMAVHFVDERTLLVFNPEAAEQMLTPAPQPTPLVNALQALGGGDDLLVVMSVTEQLQEQIDEQKFMLQMMAGESADLVDHVRTLVLRASLEPSITLQVGIETDDPRAANQFLQHSQQGLALAKQQLAESRQELAEAIPLLGAGLVNAINRMLDQTRPAVHERTFEVTLTVPNEFKLLVPMGVAWVVEQMQGARRAAGASRTRNNLKQMGLAFHNYHDTQNAFPAQANYEGEKPLLSWRVHVLPYLDEGALYNQFKLDEPWDSEHNKALLEQMPDIYADPDEAVDEPGHTRYLAVSGKGAAFEGTRGKRISAFQDGVSNSIMAVEAAVEQAVPWTKPADLDIDAEGTLDALLTAADEGFHALFADGSVRLIDAFIDRRTLRNLFTIADGNPVELD